MFTIPCNTANSNSGIKSKPSNWVVPISRWSIWQTENENNALPDVSFIDPATRRKLSSLTKISLKVAHDCAHDIAKVRLVYASQHGDLSRTTSMLTDLANNEALSPTTFSMSVLNAFTGIYSILKQDTSPSTSISASASTFGFGLLEAYTQWLSSPQVPVLYVYSDVSVPKIYESGFYNEPIAIGILLDKETNITIRCETSSNELNKNEASNITQLQAFIECLLDKKNTEWQGEGRVWRWCCNES